MGALSVRRSIFVGFAYFLTVISTIAVSRPNPGFLAFVLSWLLALSLVISCVTDARIAGKTIPWGVQFVMLLTWPIALPICLIWARQWWGVLWTLVFGGTLFLTCYVTDLLCYYSAVTHAA